MTETVYRTINRVSHLKSDIVEIILTESLIDCEQKYSTWITFKGGKEKELPGRYWGRFFKTLDEATRDMNQRRYEEKGY